MCGKRERCEMKKSRAGNPIDMRVSAALRARRLEREMSQDALGKALGVSFQQVQKYENGRNRLSASALYLAAKALGVDVGFFFKGVTQ